MKRISLIRRNWAPLFVPASHFLRFLGLLWIILLAGSSDLSRAKPQAAQEQRPTQEKKERSEKKSFLSRLAENLAKDLAASSGLLQWSPGLTDQSGQATLSEPGKYKGGEWFVAPIPLSNPTLGTGLAGGAGYIYRLDPDDEISPPTTTAVGGLGTSNKTWGIGGTHQMAWAQDRFRLNATAAYGDIKYRYRLLPEDPEDERLRIPINLKGTFVATDFLTRILERVFIGPRFTALISTVRPDIELDTSAAPDPHLQEQYSLLTIESKLISLGFEVMRDTRDSLFYPRRGSLGTFRADFLRKGMGSDFSYDKYIAAFSLFRSLSTHQVLAATVNVCAVNGDAPFFDECYLGQEKNLRGYDMAWKQGTALFAAQAEYRLELFWRIGLVGFFGVGQVAKGFNKFNKDGWLPGGGFGLRFLVAKENHVNMRIDFAWGKGSSATYLSGGEVF